MRGADEPHEAAERLLGTAVSRVGPLGGSLFAVTTADGEQLVAKRAPGPNAHDAEAAGLRWLASSGDVPLPEVRGHDSDWLLIERIGGGRPSATAARAFGAGLAALHLRGAPAHGAPPPGGPVEAWIGLARMRNETEADWPTFYAAHRIEPYVRQARDRGLFDTGQAAVFDDVCEHLPAIAGPAEPPARLHGDAWCGNIHWAEATDGRVWLLDPAAHGGHRETDLAMLRLFGAPHEAEILAAYAAAAEAAGAPLADGWRDRVGLHQLFPLLVHTVLFGGAYAGRALAAARSALALR
ncbi:fructosamine kinase family protein [Haloechinothrix sp. LS1_15]|uniref:fructosamine kinase family protein n=1 Tax=Haloechinothrix sp. LS1_15 TaxID=2652248 RepID=UPI002947068C|nr:fructosamine kinase family protein [Haloechinothrix sp. LS1_15]MDV6013828.1 fructosamine kinase [Haloechinothrix sp. LS1_15]